MPIINMVYKKKWKWEPSSNTLLYLPMVDDLLDHSGKSVSTSPESSVSITTLNGVKCGYFNSGQIATGLATQTSTDKTVSFWLYPVGYGSIYNSNPCGIYSGDGATLQSNGTIYFAWMQGSGGANWGDVSAPLVWNSWNYIAFTKKSVYVNGQLIATSSSSAGIVNLGYNYVIGGNPNGNCGYTKYNGYLSEFIMESSSWSADEILNYYNNTKKNYEDDISYYQEVEYIENTSTGPRIDTGVMPTQNTKSQIKFRNLSVTGNVIYGMYNGDDNSDYRFFNYGSNIYWDLGSSRVNGSTCNANTDYEFEIGNNYVKNVGASGNLVSGSVVGSYTGNTTIKLNHGSNGLSANRWYYVKIWDGATQVRDMIPCYRIGDSVIGMFDKVNNKFYTNSGSGTFTKGPDVN